MSRLPPRNDGRYQPLPGSGASAGLFDRRNPAPDYRQHSSSYNQRSEDRRPVPPPPQHNRGPGLFPERAYESPQQRIGVFRVAKVSKDTRRS